MNYQWWAGQPVFEIHAQGNIQTREEALKLTKTMVDAIEASSYMHVVVLLDLTGLGQSPATAALLSGSLPATDKIEHLILVNAPMLMRMAAMPFVQLRDKIHFVSSFSDAQSQARTLAAQLPQS